MKKNQSFHIIIRGFLTQKGDFIGFDTYSNSVFISKKIITINNFKEISEETPLFCLAKVEEVINKKVNDRKLHFLKCNYAEFDLIKMLSALSDEFVVEFVYLNEAQVDKFKFVKLILDEYNFFIEKKQFLAGNNIGFNRNKDEENYELPFLLLSSGCIKLKQKLDKYINFFGYENEIKKMDYGTYLEFNYGEMIIGPKSKINNVFSINLRPLYTNIKTIYNLIDRKAEEPIYKIITKNQLLSFDISEGDYFDKFFELINSKFEPKEDKLQYLLEHPLEFGERLRNTFDTMFVYTITPIISQTEYYKILSFEQIHQQLIDLVEYLEKINIFNVIILPPEYTDIDAKLHIDYHLYPPKDLEDSYDGWAELGDQEMNRMDEETDGFWRL